MFKNEQTEKNILDNRGIEQKMDWTHNEKQ